VRKSQQSYFAFPQCNKLCI